MKASDNPARSRSLPLERLSLNADELSGKSLRRALALVTLAWGFGSVWMTATAGAPLTLFAKALGASEFQFGVVSALPFVASLISMPASLVTERTGARKKIFLWGLYTQRLLWIPIGLLPFWMIRQYGFAASGSAMAVFLILLFAMQAGGAVGSPAWTSWMADVVPERLRGIYFSRRRQIGILTALPAAFLVGWLLDRHTDPTNPLITVQWCAIIFLCAAVFGVTDIHLFHYVPEIHQKPQSASQIIRSLAAPLRNRKFMFHVGFVATMTFAVSFMGIFVTLYVIDRVLAGHGGANVQVQLMLIVVPMLAQLFILPVWGKAADRMGKKPVLILASLGLAPVGWGWCFLGPENIWLGYVLGSLGAALWTGLEVANLNLVLEMIAPDEDDPESTDGGGSAFYAVNSVFINIAGCLGGLASGVVAQLLRNWSWTPVVGFKPITSYEILFLLSGTLRLLAVLIFLPFIQEHAAKPTVETLRFMTANIYNNLFNAVLLPLRFAGWKRGESYTTGQAQDRSRWKTS